MRFIDLFAGLGGFHVALRRLGHTCVFASELDEGLKELYAKNFGIAPQGDIRKIPVESIPAHDILCAGSPCQPFSKAGEQPGFDCPKWGDLLEYVIKILQYHKPRYFILENVPNLGRHDSGETFKALQRRLNEPARGALHPHSEFVYCCYVNQLEVLTKWSLAVARKAEGASLHPPRLLGRVC